jgi:hypothetical protein
MLAQTDLESCIQECTRCHAVCVKTVQYCLKEGGRHAAAHHVRLMQDCAEMCLTSADFMLRESDLHPETCGLCAKICVRCASSCEQVGGGNDALMNECAGACRACAKSCNEMSIHGN